MSQKLDVSSVTISDVLYKLRSREWMIPQFQRNFVWTIADVSNLVYSILESRPIGMVTIWQQVDEPGGLPLTPISVRDRGEPTELPEISKLSATKYAVLDGRQRCTAIAIAFGGLRPQASSYKFWGRFFLNVAEKEDSNRIEFVREQDVSKRGLLSDSAAIGQGLFPFSSSRPDENLMQQWYRYTQAIRDPNNYPNSELPDDDELERRNNILAKSFEGILETKLAVNTVSSSYSLADICEIFEVLNTSGTKVSTVDLIHSWLYADTVNDAQPLHLRGWLDKLSGQTGTVGWASGTERPELIAQMSTAAYITRSAKPSPRSVGKAPMKDITSIKAGELLASVCEKSLNNRILR